MNIDAQVSIDLFGPAMARLAGRAAEAVKASAERIVEEARQLCPVGEGEDGLHLVETITDVALGPLEREVRAGDGLPDAHAAFVEYGTGARGAASSFSGKPPDITYTSGWPGMRAQPYLTPAAEAEKPRFEAAVAEVLRGE